ncbi:exportin-5 isoform X2 [Strongylocentrotus purpuratus]|uniref:Importin N-terminal domain-containing protein n=1 Tax=Strongylocentrotus purpuratus TaxID=7668 RepID=A0A7M7PQW0_STRPU|nr:exportin-5 isoform X2 [Strongylocentrotus purpuratus]
MELEEQTLQLIDAVNVTMNPVIDQESRMKAYQICENFKETSPHCVACGALLTDTKHSPVIRHFGLQLLEHFVRFKWNDATGEQKLQFKNLILEMITKKSTNVLEEENYIKEGLVKIVVEMIKREWPQQWPSLLEELDQMCQIGDSQTELVLLILLRLVEDVVSFHNVQQSRRRKDLWQALTSNMAQISSFLIKVLEMYSEKYQSLETSAPQSNEAKSACKVTQTVLVTLCGFVEWMDAKHLFKEENRLLIFLYQLLRNEELKMLAAECLQLIVHRKGKIEERKPLMVLFCDVAMTELFNAAVKACSAGLDEKNHLFVKKLCQVITGLGSQMCAIWAIEGEVFEPPSNLASYLKTLYSFTQHASTHVCHLTSASWMAFLRHEHMPRTQAVLEIIPNLCQTYISTSQKIGYPSRNDSPACAYARIDFDSDDEFFHFFAAHRYYQLEILRHATGLCPETTFSIAARWLQELLAAPLEREEGKELCTNHSPSTIKWDAMSSYLDSVITTLIKKDQLPTQQAIELIQATLNCKIEDPVILSFQLTCISTLFPVLHHSNQHVEGVLDKLFAAAVYSWPGLTKTRTRSVQNVRRHACSAMVKMCRDHQTLMLPHFEKIYTQVKRLCSDPEQLTQLERVTLSEALILINNGLHNWNRQSALIAEIMKPITEVWLSPHITEIIQSPESFIHNIGLDHPSDAQPNQEDVHNKNRAQIFSCISTSQAVVKRSCWPSDPQVAAAGGFISGHLPSGAPIYKNPSTPHILPILPNLFTLARTLNAMWSPECRGKVCPEYTKSYNMTENERNTILGLYGNSTEIPTNKPVVEKVQIFLTVVYETTCHLFADCFQSLGYEFFAAEGLSSQLLESIFTNLHHLPDYRLRHIIRVVTKGFVQSCPRECWQSVLVPVMTGLTSFMVHRLNQQWAIILQRAESGEAREEQNDEQETQEVLEDHLTRTVTKEFMELLGNLCWSNNRTSSSSVTVKEEGGGGGGGELEMETEEAMEQGEGGAGNSAKSEPATISDLGKVILQNERLCESIVTCIYTAMSWPDSGVCMKACRLSWLIVQELATRPLLPEAVTHLYTSILRGLQIHGEHDTCRAELVYRAMNHYELLREKFPVLTEVMLSLPHCTQPALQKFHEKVPSSKPSEKKKREAFKSFIQSFIGVPVSQKFKRKEVIRDLPAIFKPMKPKLNVVDASVGAEEAGLVMLFASDADL